MIRHLDPEELAAIRREIAQIRQDMNDSEERHQRALSILKAEYTLEVLLFALRDLMVHGPNHPGAAKHAYTYGRDAFLALWAWMDERKTLKETQKESKT